MERNVMPKKNVWVTKEADDWAVRLEGSSRPLSRHATQKDALGVGRQRAERDKVELIWQGRDGQIKGRNSFGGDPRRRTG
jgi:hypothetical protein